MSSPPRIGVAALAAGTAIVLILSGCSTSDTRASAYNVTAEPAFASGNRGAAYWIPPQGATWHLQLNGVLRPAGVEVYDIDGADTSRDAVARLKSDGARAICYFSAGTHEDWRADADRFPDAVVGEAMEDWAGERWLDTRRLDQLLPIMEARIADCSAKGFDAVDPDNIDGYLHHTGFDLTREDSTRYVRELARIAHDHGLSIGLKNSLDILPQVSEQVDFAVNEECQAYHECGAYDEFLASGKAVFNVEYTDNIRVLPGISSIRASYDLDRTTVAAE